MSDDETTSNTRREPVEVECSGCGESFEHNKRGAIPKRCPDCRDSKVPGAKAEGAPRRPKSVVELETNMRVQLAGLATLATLADPWLGAHCMKNVERGAKVHAQLAATNPKIREALEKGTELAGWGPVAVFWITFLVPVLARYRGQRAPAPAPAPAPATDPAENVVNFVRPSHAV